MANTVSQALILAVDDDARTFTLAFLVHEEQCIHNRDRFVIHEKVPLNDILFVFNCIDHGFVYLITRLFIMTFSPRYEVPVGR